MEEQHNDLEKILAERVKLDDMLKSKYSKKTTIMFTDIKGSTAFYEQRGDLDGRMMVHRHNEMVLPVIAAHRGKLIKTIGDATMSQYEDPTDGVRAAIQIQITLKTHNDAKPAGEQIHVRIGLNTGMGIVEEKDVFGDVVNVAARVESLADGGEIMVTDDLYREVKNNDEFIFRHVEAAMVRGKKEALKAFRVVWHEEELHMGKTRKAPDAVARKEGVFVLEASVAGKNLKVSAFERSEGEERAVKNYKELVFNEQKISEYTRSLIDVLNRANRQGKIGNDLLVKLKEVGGLLFDELVPLEIKEKLVKTGENNLMLNIDDRLVHVPWELLYDGKNFLCQRFSVGRSVSTKQAVTVVARALSRPLKMQILADPRGDLSASYDEGVGIKKEVEQFEDWLDVSLKTTDIGVDYVKAKIRNFDIVHYAGHADHNAERPEDSGWLLKDGKLRAADIVTMAGSKPMPALVFSNACQTGQTGEWKLDAGYGTRIFGLANAFLVSGVQHYIGTFWEIPDEAGHQFAKSFYKSLVNGATIGEALRQARHALIRKYGEDTIVWASYMLYGDPTTRYVVAEQAVAKSESAKAPVKAAERETLATTALRGAEEGVLVAQKSNSRTLLMAAAGGLVIAGIAAFLFLSQSRGPAASSTPGTVVVQHTGSTSDAVTQKRIDEMVVSLAAQYRSGKIEQPTVSDAWSSRAITMVFMDVQAEGAGGDKAVNLLSMRVTQALQTEGRVQMVERELLDKLLAELKLSASNLADPTMALKIGKLLSARIMVTGSMLPEKKGMTLALRFIDTETTAVRKVLTVDAMSTSIDRELAENLATGINEWVKADYPVRGRILSLAGDNCFVNLGQDQGLKKGDRLEIVKEAKKGSGFYAVMGEIEINQVTKDKAEARIINKAEPVKENSQIRIK